MKQIGAELRRLRQRWGLTLREVEVRSLRLAERWGRTSYSISASWLDRVEREGRELSLPKFIVLAVIYNIEPKDLLDYCPAAESPSDGAHPLLLPNRTQLLTKGPLEEQARIWVPDTNSVENLPDHTALISSEDQLAGSYRRGVIGRLDRTMDPMIPPGSIVLINSQRRTIAHRREWTNEFNRPVYFLITHEGYLCGWCDLDKNSEWLTLAPHTLSYTLARRWRYRREVEVIGRVAAVLLRMEEPQTTS